MDGKGLGMNEEGSVDFVRVKKNRENNGECHVIFSLWKRFILVEGFLCPGGSGEKILFCKQWRGRPRGK